MTAGLIRAFKKFAAAPTPQFCTAAFGAYRLSVPAASDQLIAASRLVWKPFFKLIPGLGKITP